MHAWTSDHDDVRDRLYERAMIMADEGYSVTADVMHEAVMALDAKQLEIERKAEVLAHVRHLLIVGDEDCEAAREVIDTELQAGLASVFAHACTQEGFEGGSADCSECRRETDAA